MTLRISQANVAQQAEANASAAPRNEPAAERPRRPRVSIGLPVYNGDRFLRQALDSILAQTFRDFELIISDNGSTDQTESICREYAARDPRIRYFRSEVNLGATWNFNRVVELSSGEYFKWIAHDDIHAPEFLARCAEVLDRDPSVVLSYPKATDIDENGNVLWDNNTPLDVYSPKAHQRFRHLACINHACLPVFGLMRAKALRRTPLLGNYVASDRVFLVELSFMGRFYNVPETLFFHREHPKRSTRVLPVLQERMVWYDPFQPTRMLFPHWRLFHEYFSSIARSPLEASQQALCYLQMVRWVWWNWRGLLEDLAYAAKRIVRQNRMGEKAA